MRTWYNLQQKDAKASIAIFDGIGEYGVSAKSFLNDFRAATGDEIDVEINSPGGDVFAGLAIYNGMRASGKKINVKVLGVAASAASLVAMAGDTIEMPENTFMMVHNPWSFAAGDAEELRATADMLDKIGASLVGTYSARTGRTHEDVTAMLNDETWMTAQEAFEAGFATKVTKAIEVRASFDPDRLPENVKAVFSAAKPQPTAPHVNHADLVAQVAAEAQVPECAELLALDDTLTDRNSIMQKAQSFCEIKALCKLVGKPEAAMAFITENKTMSEVRSSLLAARAANDEALPINNFKRISNDPTNGTQPKVVTSAGIWNAYLKSQGARV